MDTDLDTLCHPVWQRETNGGFPLAEVKDQDQDLQFFIIFFPNILR